MKSFLVAGIVMIVLGGISLGYNYTYTTKETVLQVGPLKAVAEESHTVAVPAILGWVLVVGGICVVAFGALSKKSS
ncbi:MAG: hypothetical protein WAO95_16925 [Burkholderiales bacterium]